MEITLVLMSNEAHNLNFFADSHVGLVREDNEDSYGFCSHDASGTSFAIVADGVGGHDRGEVASQLTVQLFLEAWRDFVAKGSFSTSSAKKFLSKNMKDINSSVFQLNIDLENSMPMGTTVVAAVFLKNKVVLGHIGDSRAYVVRKGRVEQLTRDHSYVEELLRNKMISEKEAESHPLGHIITRSVGPLDKVSMEIQTCSAYRGDRFVLCSDGLTNHVSNDEVADMVASADTPRTAVKKMVVSSLHRGGEDNVTVLSCFFN